MNTIETALIPLQVVAQKHKNPGPVEAASTILPELGGNLIFELVEEFWQAGIRNYIFTSEADEPSLESWEEEQDEEIAWDTEFGSATYNFDKKL